MRTIHFALALGLFAGSALAQGEPPVEWNDDVPLEAYLDALGQISPAARDAAVAYLDGHQRRCGRSLTALELRRAVAEGDGDPVLMAMIRAAQQRDAATLRRLSASVSCARRR